MLRSVQLAEAESLRKAHKPAQVRLLFVGESAPASGTFFYAQNSTIYFETRAAFDHAFPMKPATKPFLDLFMELGCYLDDLCLEPINNLPVADRQRKRIEAVGPLAERLRGYRPQMVIAIGKTTAAPHVESALQCAGLTQVPLRLVAFPGRPEHKVMFHREMASILQIRAAMGGTGS